MGKFLLKGMFGFSSLEELKAGENVKVACQNELEYKCIRSLVCQYAKAHPRDGISKYTTEIERQGTGLIVTVTAVK
jgi:hypothetical protein